jgi:hypothetical protein
MVQGFHHVGTDRTEDAGTPFPKRERSRCKISSWSLCTAARNIAVPADRTGTPNGAEISPILHHNVKYFSF